MRTAAFLVPALVAGMPLPAQSPIQSDQLRPRLRTEATFPLGGGSSLVFSNNIEVQLKLKSSQNEWITIQVNPAGMSVWSKHPWRITTQTSTAVGERVDAHACLTEGLHPWFLTSKIKEEAQKAAKKLRDFAEKNPARKDTLLAWAELLEGTWRLGHLRVDRSTGQGGSTVTLTSSSSSSSTSSSTSSSSTSSISFSQPSPSPAPSLAFLDASAHEEDAQQESLDPRAGLAEDILKGGHTAAALQDLERRLGGAADTQELDEFKAALRHLAGLVFEKGEFRKVEAGEQEKKETKAP